MIAGLTWALIPVLLFGLGCSDDEHALFVDLRTDLVPGIEFVTVRTTIDGEGEMVVPSDRAQDWVGGVRVAEGDEFAPGTRTVVVALYDAFGGRVGSRVATVDHRQDLGITIVLTRDCSLIACPGPGAASDVSSCLSGRCVDPSCLPEAPDACPPPECNGTSDCPAAPACATAQCVSGACLYGGDDALCAADEYCAPESGCAPRPIAVPDAGPPVDAGSDTSPVDAGPMDCGPEPFVRWTFDGSLAGDIVDLAPRPPDPVARTSGTVMESATGAIFAAEGAIRPTNADSQTIRDAILATGSFTVLAWMNPTSTGVVDGTRMVVSMAQPPNDRPFYLGHGDPGRWDYTIQVADTPPQGWGASGHRFVPGTWHLFGVSFDRNMSRTQATIDGEHMASRLHATNELGWASGYDLSIGREINDTAGFHGSVAEVAFWDSALTEAQLTCLFSRGP